MQTSSTHKEYICECGKIFTNPQSFNGHKSHCKKHLITKGGEVNYANYITRQVKAATAANTAKKNLATSLSKAAQISWVEAQHTCEHCGKVMVEKFGSGRFCSSSCAHSREHSSSTKEKIKAALSKTLESKGTIIKPKKLCSICGKPIKSYNKTGVCKECLNNTSEGLKIKQALGRKGYATMQANGTHKGWQSRKVISYAEKFWQQVLDNNSIAYEREFLVVHNKTHYFLDFKLIKNNIVIDLEIDGKQHTYEDRAASDKVRDELLQALGYTVYRIPWNEIKTDSGKSEMQQKIATFLEFYSSL